jgi:hypothetical protein
LDSLPNLKTNKPGLDADPGFSLHICKVLRLLRNAIFLNGKAMLSPFLLILPVLDMLAYP